MSALRHLQLIVEPDVPEALQWLAAVLKSIPTINILERLHITFVEVDMDLLVEYSDTSSDHWSHLDRILAAVKTPTLPFIDLVFSSVIDPPTQEAVSTFLESYIPLVTSTGILSLYCDADLLYPYNLG